MCTDLAKYKRAILAVAMVVIAVISWAAKSQSNADKIEGVLKKEGKIYLVVDFSERLMTLKQSGTVLREYAFAMDEDSAVTTRLADDLNERDTTGATIEIVSLLSGAATVPEAELEIICEETHLGEEQIQRYLPTRFVIVINDGPCLHFETEIVPNKKFHLQIINDYYRRVMIFLSGRKTLHIRLAPDDAMSLYGAARDYPKVVFRR